jgi:hypothetical protein
VAQTWGIVLIAVASVAVGRQASWTDAGTKRGIALAFRDDSALGAREVRATTELPFPATQIASVVCDLSHYETLLSGVDEARVIAGKVPRDYEIYFRYAPRFVVVGARDVVVRVQSHSTGALGCHWSELTGRVPERNGIVRMPLLRGSWTVETLAAARSRVVYQIAVRPGGRLPAWLVRRGAIGALPEIIEQVRRCLAGESATNSAGVVSCRE